jgi:hypothetical protein
MNAGTDVAEPNLRKDRGTIRVTSHIEDARVGGTDIIVSGQVRQTPGSPERRDRTHHDLWVQSAHRLVIKAHPLDYARCKILNQNIHLWDKSLQDRESCGLLRIETETFLAAILLNVIAASPVAHERHRASQIPIRRKLNLDYLGAHLPEISCCRRACQSLSEIEHLVTFQHPGFHQRLREWTRVANR